MPWCPKCKNEYREGVKVCSDCGTELVDELKENDMKLVAIVDTEEYAKKYTDYLSYSKIESSVELNEEDGFYHISVHKKDWKQARSEFDGFHMVETDRANAEYAKKLTEIKKWVDDLGSPEAGDAEAGDDAGAKDTAADKDADLEERELTLAEMAEASHRPAGTYTRKADAAKELSSTAVTFLGFAVLLLAFAVLNILDVIHIFHNNYLSIGVFLVLALVFCFIGLGSLKRSKAAASQVDAEEEFIKTLNDWMKENIHIMTDLDVATDENGDGVIDDEEQDNVPRMELRYLHRTAAMRKAIIEQFGELDEDFLDSILDEFYDKYITD